MAEVHGAASRGPRRSTRTGARIFAAEVRAVRDLTPRMRRITVAAPELADYRPVGPDEYLGLLLPAGDDAPLVLPDPTAGPNIRAAVAEIPEELRPELRWYTLRAHRPERAEIDIDCIVHGDEGPGTRFARRARPGTRLGIRECTALYVPAAAAGARLLIGDESAIPAIAAILETTRHAGPTRVFIEIPERSERQRFDAPTRVDWVDRGGLRPGIALERAVRDAALPPDIASAWVCGERDGVQRIRRHLVDDRGIGKQHIVFSGYWRLGHARG